jgi:hypothetical protein
MALPDSLAHKIELFRERGKVARYDEQLFAEPSWVAVFLGQGVEPRDHDRLADVPPLADVERMPVQHPGQDRPYRRPVDDARRVHRPALQGRSDLAARAGWSSPPLASQLSYLYQ